MKGGALDLIGAARPSIADPFLPAKIREGRVEDIRECIGCNICVSMDSYGLPVRCTQNPTVSEVWRRGWHPEAPALSKGRQSHLIGGSGPAGDECAVTLMRAGDKITVAEARDEAGGRVAREGRLRGLASWLRVRDYRMYQLGQSADADVFLSSEMGVEDVSGFDADNVILATGAIWRRDGVGSTRFDAVASPRRIFSADDVMDGVAIPAKSVVVYDDDHFYMASVVAEVLARAGHEVSYATPLPTIATWTDYTLEQEQIIDRLCELGVELHPNTVLQSDGGFRSALIDTAVDVPGDMMVFVGARLPRNELYDGLKGLIGERLYRVGDSVAPGTIQAAVLSGYTVAREILSGAAQVPFKREQLPF